MELINRIAEISSVYKAELRQANVFEKTEEVRQCLGCPHLLLRDVAWDTTEHYCKRLDCVAPEHLPVEENLLQVRREKRISAMRRRDAAIVSLAGSLPYAGFTMRINAKAFNALAEAFDLTQEDMYYGTHIVVLERERFCATDNRESIAAKHRRSGGIYYPVVGTLACKIAKASLL